MQLPTQLSRNNPHVHKNSFGHVLILAGSKRMLGAAALTSLAALRSGAGLITVGVPESLNTTLQKKINHSVMTFPLKETKEGTISDKAFLQLSKELTKYSVIALGPGLSINLSTQKFIFTLIQKATQPLVIDADALNAISKNPSILIKTSTPKILTPHSGEMARLTDLSKDQVEKDRRKIALIFAKKFHCALLLKGHHTVVASSNGKTYINKTGNAGMAKAGSGDVLTGIIAAFVAQGLSAFDAAKFGSYIHGKAGDLAAKKRGKISLIPTDILDLIPEALKSC
ncbi:MAG: NAD(P)H-hydrate dehydratase [Candidatus Omnitrophica bacterium]|nr:NAD(P)H-hydrate dehydratase [Candidatus Omnitrophota bacterium]